MNKFSHVGTLIGTDSRSKPGTKFVVKLRETKNYWITNNFVKYKKTNGREAGCDWPMYSLKLDTIKKIADLAAEPDKKELAS